MTTLQKRLHDLREDHDESQRQIAALVGVAPPRVSEWETGFHEPRLDVLIVLADHWGVSLDYLAGISDNPKRS